MDLKNVTLEQLKAENPELVNSIISQERRERIKGLIYEQIRLQELKIL